MKNKIFMAAMAVAAIFCLTACESSNFKASISENSEYVILTVTTDAATNWSFIALPTKVYQELGFNDPEAQKMDIAKYCASNFTKLELRMETGSKELTGEKALQKKYYGTGTYYMIVYSYKSGSSSEVNTVYCFKYEIQ